MEKGYKDKGNSFGKPQKEKEKEKKIIIKSNK